MEVIIIDALSMSRIIGIVGVIVVVLILVWFFWMKKGSEVPTGMENTLNQAENMANKAETKTEGVVSSIKDAMGLGQKMACTYKVDMNGQEYISKVFVDGEKYKADSVVAGIATHALYDGQNQYVWTEGTKQGFKMSKTCLDEFKNQMGQAPSTGTGSMKEAVEDYAKTFESAKNVSCEPATTADFSVPADVVFTDQCEMMKKSMEMMKQMQQQMPQSAPSSNGSSGSPMQY